MADKRSKQENESQQKWIQQTTCQESFQIKQGTSFFTDTCTV